MPKPVRVSKCHARIWSTDARVWTYSFQLAVSGAFVPSSRTGRRDSPAWLKPDRTASTRFTVRSPVLAPIDPDGRCASKDLASIEPHGAPHTAGRSGVPRLTY